MHVIHAMINIFLEIAFKGISKDLINNEKQYHIGVNPRLRNSELYSTANVGCVNLTIFCSDGGSFSVLPDWFFESL